MAVNYLLRLCQLIASQFPKAGLHTLWSTLVSGVYESCYGTLPSLSEGPCFCLLVQRQGLPITWKIATRGW